jgi:hypothetical protein
MRICSSHCDDNVCHIVTLLWLVDCNVIMFDTLRHLEMFGTLRRQGDNQEISTFGNVFHNVTLGYVHRIETY